MQNAPVDSLQQLQLVPPHWPIINDTVPWVALIIGFLIYFIAYFAGGRLNKGKMIFAITFSVVIGALSFPLFEKLYILIAGQLGERFSWILTMLLFMAFVIAIGVNMYEIITVTAREAHPTSERW